MLWVVVLLLQKRRFQLKMTVSEIDPLKAVLWPERGGGDKSPNIKDNSILLWKANSLYKKKKITAQLLITSKRVKSSTENGLIIGQWLDQIMAGCKIPRKGFAHVSRFLIICQKSQETMGKSNISQSFGGGGAGPKAPSPCVRARH